MADIDLIMSHEQRHIERNYYRSRLIELVRANPILWDKKSADFNQRTMKIQKWLELSEQLGVSTDKLRRTWENLRDQYRRDLKRTLSKNIRSKWRFFDDMNFIRSNVRIKGSSLGDGGNSDTESEYEDMPCDKFRPCIFSSSILQSNKASNITATPVATFHPIQLSTEWKLKQQTQEQSLKKEEQTLLIKNLHRQDSPQQSCDSSEGQNFDDDNIVVDNVPTQDIFKIEIDSDTNDSIANQDVIPRPSTTTAQRQELLAVPQPYTCTTTAASAPSHNDSEACVTTSGNSTGTKRRRRHSTEDTPTENECKQSFRNQRLDDAPQDSSELQDEDYHFVMSILPALRHVTRHRKFPLRSQIMTLISKELEESND